MATEHKISAVSLSDRHPEQNERISFGRRKYLHSNNIQLFVLKVANERIETQTFVLKVANERIETQTFVLKVANESIEPQSFVLKVANEVNEINLLEQSHYWQNEKYKKIILRMKSKLRSLRTLHSIQI